MVIVFALGPVHGARAAPDASPPTVVKAVIIFVPSEVASAYRNDCMFERQPAPYPHPKGSVFVGGVGDYTANTCYMYQGLVRFDLGRLEPDTILSAYLSYESLQNYEVDGTSSRDRATCIGSIGIASGAWKGGPLPIEPTLDVKGRLRPPSINVKSSSVDVTTLLKDHFADVAANGFALDGKVEDIARRRCLAAIGNLRLEVYTTP